MHFGLTNDQQELKATVAALLSARCSPELIREAIAGNSNSTTRLWMQLSEMGLPLGMVDESSGGLGLDEIAMTGIVEELGRHLVPLPIVETMVVAAPLLVAAGEWRLLEKLTGGATTATCSLDGTRLIPYPQSDLALIRDGEQVVILENLPEQVTPRNTTDRSRPIGYVTSLIQTRRLPIDADLQRLASWRGIQATSACLLGIADQMLQLTVKYVSVRQQFGKPVGSFQAVKHRLADVAIDLELTRSMVYAAGWALAAGEPLAERDVRAAKAMASELAVATAKACLHSHGGIGYTTEYDLSLWMKRAWALAAAWGDAASHRQHLSALLEI